MKQQLTILKVESSQFLAIVQGKGINLPTSTDLSLDELYKVVDKTTSSYIIMRLYQKLGIDGSSDFCYFIRSDRLSAEGLVRYSQETALKTNLIHTKNYAFTASSESESTLSEGMGSFLNYGEGDTGASVHFSRRMANEFN
jgi:hypothetical protein